jgi:adenylylsulfate kinase
MKKNYLSNVIWLTGLSGAGKSTLANKLNDKLKIQGFKIKKIDGDTFRKKTQNLRNFSKKNITNNNNLIIDKLKQIYKNYDYSIISVISPLRLTRIRAKNFFGKKYFEVYVKCGIKELQRRDTKGLYKLAKERKINNLIGYNSKILYENSKYEKIVVNTKLLNIKNSINKIIKKISKSYEKI